MSAIGQEISKPVRHIGFYSAAFYGGKVADKRDYAYMRALMVQRMARLTPAQRERHNAAGAMDAFDSEQFA